MRGRTKLFGDRAFVKVESLSDKKSLDQYK